MLYMDFPYYNYIYNDNDRIQRFKRLINYSLIPTSSNISRYHRTNVSVPGIYYLYNGNYKYLEYHKDDYFNVYMLSVMFSDNCMVKCKFGKHISPYDYYINNKENIIKSLIDQQIDTTPLNIRDYIYDNTITCSNHNPAIIMYFIKKYNAKKIIDMSGGWGDRLLGCIASNIEEYLCTDPNTCVIESYKNMINLLLKLSPNPNAKITIKCEGFENIKVDDNYYDMAYTSPPYFDLEKYSNQHTQSIYIYNNENLWWESFAKPCIQKLINSIKYDGHCILYIGQQAGKKYMEKMIDWIGNVDNVYYLGCIFYGTYPKNHPIYIYTKTLNIPIKLYNPIIKIEKTAINYENNVRHVNLISDANLIGGTLLRGMVDYLKDLFANNNVKTLIINKFCDDITQMAISYALYLLKKKDIVLVIITNEYNNKIRHIVNFYHRSTKYITPTQSIGYTDNIYYLDIDNSKFVQYLTNNIKNVCKKIKFGTMWIYIKNESEKILLHILIDIFKNNKFIVVNGTGIKIKNNNITIYDDYSKTQSLYDNKINKIIIPYFFNHKSIDDDNIYYWAFDGIHRYMNT
jgi:hypothetical protein